MGKNSLKYIFAVLCIALASCQKYEVDTIPQDKGTYDLYVMANIGVGNATKVVMTPETDGSGEKIVLSWKESGETFDVVNGEGVVVATFEQTPDTEDAVNLFYGALTDDGEDVKSLDDTYTIIYPSSAPLDLSSQSGALDEGLVRMTASYSGKLEDISSVDFTGHQTSIIKLAFRKEDETFIGGTNIVKVEAEYQGDIIGINANNSREEIYMFVNPSSGEHTIDFIVKTTGGNYKGQLDVTKDIESGKYYRANVDVAEINTYSTINPPIAVLPEGSGSEADPYLIRSTSNLRWLLDNHAASTYYQLESDFIIESTNEYPWMFGGVLAPFAGVLNGNGKTIYGTLYAGADNPIGGFVGENHGAIINLNLSAEVLGSGAVAPLLGYNATGIGAVAGLNSGIVKNCSSNGSVSAVQEALISSKSDVVAGVGGIVGANLGGDILNCNNSASVTGVDTYDCGGGWTSAAGIVGVTIGGLIEDCTNDGYIVSGKANSGESVVSGILGFGRRMAKDVVIDGCTNNGLVSAVDSDGGFYIAAGIVGYLTDYLENGGMRTDGNSRITDCENDGEIRTGTITGSVNVKVAGIVGSSWIVDISNCTNTANGILNIGRISSGEVYAGGIAGMFGGDEFKLDATDVTTTMSSCANYGAINGSKSASIQYIGGIIAEIRTGKEIYITQCVNSGNVSADNSEYTGGKSYSLIGGITGLNNSGWASVYNCQNSGAITGAKVGCSLVGGITGANVGLKMYSLEKYYQDHIYGCTNYGQVSIPVSGVQPDPDKWPIIEASYLGGVVGFNNGGVTCSCNVNNFNSGIIPLVGGGEVTGCHGH
jgi:hypothetical protein